MRTLFVVLLLVTSCSLQLNAQVAADSQAQAIREFPDLARGGSEFNQRFLARLRQAKDKHEAVLQSSDWPLKLAREVGAAMNEKPTVKAVEAPGAGLRKFISLSVTELAASPFSAEGAIVKLTGISRIEPQEVERGVYELTIWGKGGGYLEATVNATQAQLISSSSELYVSISEPSKSGSKVVIHGNASRHEGLSTIPTPYWR